MSLNATPSGERPHLSFFGLRNAGKSSLVNALTNQDLSIVSPLAGTTTDPVQKAMEILPLGPVVLVDTPGLDDEGEIGALRVARTRKVLNHTDLGILVTVLGDPLSSYEKDLLQEFKQRQIPYLIVYNKSDLSPNETPTQGLKVSAKTGLGLNLLKEEMAKALAATSKNPPLVRDLVAPKSKVILVIPLDASAPKGRLILPQQQVLRELLESQVISLVVRPEELPLALKTGEIKLVITDSQVFDQVQSQTPPKIPLTSFSILMARYKGFFKEALAGVYALDHLPNHARILMAEGCTHHRQCEDIGTVKIPRWLRQSTGLDLEFSTSSGPDFPTDLSSYDLIVMCGGCMLNAKEIQSRVKAALAQKVPVTNYGLLIAKMRGILERSLEIFQNKI